MYVYDTNNTNEKNNSNNDTNNSNKTTLIKGLKQRKKSILL